VQFIVISARQARNECKESGKFVAKTPLPPEPHRWHFIQARIAAPATGGRHVAPAHLPL